MDEQAIKALLDKYRNGTASEEEVALLESWYLGYKEQFSEELPIERRIAAVDIVWEQLNGGEKKTVRMWPRIAAVAAVAVLLIVATYNYTNRQRPAEILPGTNKAVLTLGNGKEIQLSSQQTGVVIDASALKYNDGSLVTSEGNVAAMTLHTPRGGMYQVVLPDGSKVWLNAASTLRFPASFEGLKERKVVLDGEAYFEVVARAGQPFLVDAGAQVVQVLGTAFNINAYKEEMVTRTTLVQGSVRVGAMVLKPGEQAAGAEKVDVNVEEVVGWKNGYFVFENEQLGSIMRKIARWYDVEVEFKGEVPGDEFGGRIARGSDLKQVLRKLELTNKVHFEVEGRKIIVRK
jgi:hypothetical protein